MIRVGAFGAVSAWRDDEPIDLGGPRQRAVLGLLVAAGRRVVSTDRFVEELYEGEPPPKALGALQAYVSHLRRRLEPERERRRPATVLQSVAPGYRLTLAPDAVDVWDFEDVARRIAASPTPLEVTELADRALGLWHDEPFAGYPDAAWATTERTRLVELRGTVVSARARAALELGRSGEVVRDLTPWVAAHALDEQAARLLALALYREERQGDSLAVLARVRRLLADELGVDPSPGLRELESDILRHDPGLEGPAPAAEPPVIVVRPDPAPAAETAPGTVTGTESATEPDDDERFVGRDDELARLRRHLHGHGVVWVSGEAGIGKSALAERFGAEAAAVRRVVRGRCPEVDGAPAAWAWVEVLREAGADPDALDADARLPFHLAAAVADALTPEDGPAALVLLDDVHRADAETLAVLRHLVGAGGRVLVLATFRADEVTPELAATLAAVSGLVVDRLDLTGLGGEAARLLVRRHAGRDLAGVAWGRVLERSGGNPLFLRELGLVAAAEGAQVARDTVPHAVRDLIARRLARLPEQVGAVLGQAAVLGREIDVDVLVALAAEADGAAEDAVLDALDTAYVAGLLEQTGPGGLRFSHALVRDTAYAQVPPLRRARLHRSAVRALERAWPGSLEQQAVHAAAGLDRAGAAEAAPLLTAAGERLAADAPREAAAHLEAALRAHDLASTPVAERLGAHRTLVRAWALAGEWVRAREARSASVAAARQAEDLGTAPPLAVPRAWVTGAPSITTPRISAADNSTEIAGVRAAVEAVPEDLDPALRVELLVALVHELELAQPEVAVPHAREAVELARALDDARLECLALNARYFLLFADPERQAVVAVGDRMLELAEAAGLTAYRGLAHFHLHATAVGRGDLDAAQRHIDEAVRIATTGQLGPLLAGSLAFAGTRAVVRGDADAAATHFTAAVDAITAEGGPNREEIDLYVRACVGLSVGPIAHLADELGAAYRRSPWQFVDLYVCSLLQAGRVDDARAAYEPVAWPRSSTWLFVTVLQSLNAIVLGDLATVRERYAALLPWSGVLARTTNGALVLGPVDLTLAGCAVVLGDLDAMREHQEVAAAMATRMQAPGWLEEAQLDLTARL